MTLAIEALFEHTALAPATQSSGGVILRALPDAQPRRHRAPQTYVIAVALDKEMGASAFRQTTAAVCAAFREVSDEDALKLCVFGAQPYTVTLTPQERHNPESVQNVVKQLQRRGVADFGAMLRHMDDEMDRQRECTLVVFSGAEAINRALANSTQLTRILGDKARAHLVAVGPLRAKNVPDALPARVETWHLNEQQAPAGLMTTLCGKRRIRIAKDAAWHIQPRDGVELDAEAFGHHARFTRDAIVVPVGTVWAGRAVETALQLHVRAGREPGSQTLLDAALVHHDEGERVELATTRIGVPVSDKASHTDARAQGALWYARSELARRQSAHLRERGHARAAALLLRTLLDEFRSLPDEARDERLHTQYAFLLAETVTPQRVTMPAVDATGLVAEPRREATGEGKHLRRSVAAEPLAAAHVTFEGDTIVGIYELAVCNSIGRSRENDIVISTGHISRHHADIVRESGQFVIFDHGSANGTYINGRRVAQRAVLHDGDVVVFSRATDTRMTFHAGTAGTRRRTTREFPAVNPTISSPSVQPRVNLAPRNDVQ